MSNGIKQGGDIGFWPLSDLADADVQPLDPNASGIGNRDDKVDSHQRDASDEYTFVELHCCNPEVGSGSTITPLDWQEPLEPRKQETMVDDICAHLGV